MNLKQCCNLEEFQFTMKVNNWFREELSIQAIARFSVGRSETQVSNKGATAQPNCQQYKDAHTKIVSFNIFSFFSTKLHFRI